MKPELKFKKLNDDVILPAKATKGSAGMDIRFYSPDEETISLVAGEPVAVPTGLFVEIPKGYELQVRSRSGLSLKGVFVLNAPGTIDSDYRGEIKVILYNMKKDNYTIARHDRIAQLVFAKVEDADIVEVDEILPTSDDRKGGFGSTGMS